MKNYRIRHFAIFLSLIWGFIPWAMADQEREFKCVVDSSYMARDSVGKQTGKKLSGLQICVGDRHRRDYITASGQVGSAIFQQVRTADGKRFWLAANGVSSTEIFPAAIDPSEVVSQPQTVAGGKGDLLAIAKTEAGFCDGTCSGDASSSNLNSAAFIILKATQQPWPEKKSTSLLEEFNLAKKKFLQKYGDGGKYKKNGDVTLAQMQWAKNHKATFIKFLYAEMGSQRASQVIVALTAYGESRGSSSENEWQNIAEMSLVPAVLKNRARSDHRTTSELISATDFNGKMAGAALSENQFSPWNTNDKNLFAMMRADDEVLISRAFKAVDLFLANKLVPLGALAHEDTVFFHNVRSTDWEEDATRVSSPKVRIEGKGTYTIRAHKVFKGV